MGLKRVRFSDIKIGDVFWSDGEKCRKLDKKRAMMLEYKVEIDLKPWDDVRIPVTPPASEPVQGKAGKHNDKFWPAFWVLIGTIIESFNW